MLKLLRVDFRRVLKDRLFMIVCIIAGAFALVTPLLYTLIYQSIGGSPEEITEAMEMLGMSINAKSMFFSSFSLGNNVGLILPVLLAIILCKDFSQGTVRNKIISGSSRTSVFFSMYTVCYCVLFGVILLHALLTLLFSLLFFPYQATPFAASDLGYFLLSLLLEVLLYAFVTALLSYLCANAKNVGIAIVLYVSIVMIMTIVTSILQVAEMVLVTEPDGQSTLKVIEFLQSINVFNFGTVIGTGTAYSIKTLLCCIFTPLVCTAGILGLGVLKFKRKDLK